MPSRSPRCVIDPTMDLLDSGSASLEDQGPLFMDELGSVPAANDTPVLDAAGDFTFSEADSQAMEAQWAANPTGVTGDCQAPIDGTTWDTIRREGGDPNDWEHLAPLNPQIRDLEKVRDGATLNVCDPAQEAAERDAAMKADAEERIRAEDDARQAERLAQLEAQKRARFEEEEAVKEAKEREQYERQRRLERDRKDEADRRARGHRGASGRPGGAGPDRPNDDGFDPLHGRYDPFATDKGSGPYANWDAGRFQDSDGNDRMGFRHDLGLYDIEMFGGRSRGPGVNFEHSWDGGGNYTFGGGYNLKSWGTPDWQDLDDERGFKGGVSLGWSNAIRTHHTDADHDGNDEWGFGFDAGPVSLDYRTETPVLDALSVVNPAFGVSRAIYNLFD